MTTPFHQPLSRREMLRRSGVGFGNLALLGLLAQSGRVLGGGLSPNSLVVRPPMFPARAKRVIFLFMHGGPSHVDTFDYKPLLVRDSGKPLPFAKPRVQFAQTGSLRKSSWEFRPYGQSGAMVSDLFPHVGAMADELLAILDGRCRVQCPFTLTKRTVAGFGRFFDRRPVVALSILLGFAGTFLALAAIVVLR